VQQAAQTAAFTLREMQDKEVQLQAQLEQALQQTKDAEASAHVASASVGCRDPRTERGRGASALDLRKMQLCDGTQ